MQTPIKHIILYALTLSIIGIITDIEFYVLHVQSINYSQQLPINQSTYCDENLSEHLFVDEFLVHIKHETDNPLLVTLSITSYITPRINNYFIDSIWQPPRFC